MVKANLLTKQSFTFVVPLQNRDKRLERRLGFTWSLPLRCPQLLLQWFIHLRLRTSFIRYSSIFPLLFHPTTQSPPDLFLLVRLHPRRQTASSGRHKDLSPFPLALNNAHILTLFLPPVPKFLLPNLLPMPNSPNTLPNAFPHNTNALWPVPPHLLLQHRHPFIHFLLTQLGPVFRNPTNNIRIPQRVHPRQVPTLTRLTKARRAARVRE